MIPLCLVTGFLGAGKTTLLKRIVDQHRNRELVYLVNEFCAADVDGAFVSQEGADVISIPGGSIFCKCLVTQFVGQLTRLKDEHPDAEGVVIEASGMANPKVIEQMLKETGLDQYYVLSNIITIVDPGTFLKLRHTLPNVLDQVAAADVLLINKTDCYPADQVCETVHAVTEINAGATCLETVNAKYDGEIFHTEREAHGLMGEYAVCKDPRYETVWIPFPNKVDADALLKLLAQHSDELYRVKGMVEGNAGKVFIEYAGGRTTIKPWLAVRQGDLEQGLAVILPGGTDWSSLRLALEQLAG
jgi:G3E family GTPase